MRIQLPTVRYKLDRIHRCNRLPLSTTMEVVDQVLSKRGTIQSYMIFAYFRQLMQRMQRKLSKGHILRTHFIEVPLLAVERDTHTQIRIASYKQRKM